MPRHVGHVAAAMLVATIALAGVACHDTTITAPPGTSSEILDGGHGGGNQHFYFLKPMLTPPATFPGTFDPMQSPVVQICQVDPATNACTGSDVADFSTSSDSGSELIRVEPGNEQYIVNWHTDQSNLDVTKTYRIRVLVGTYELGHADVDPVSSGGQLKSVDTGEYIALLDGRTLPITFRIEQGAVPSGDVPMAVGGLHTCALDASGAAYCWGWNPYGELGIGSAGGDYTSPQLVTGGHTFRSIQTGYYFSCGLDTGGQVWCWGANSDGELGNGSRSTSVPTPTVAAGGQTLTSMTAGLWHVCGIATDGTALCWGYNAQSQVGTGSATPYVITAPTAVAGGHSFTQLTAGAAHTCGLTAQGETYCWGLNLDGQLGTGSVSNAPQPTPQLVVGTGPAGHVFTSLAPGTYHTCALDASGAAYCWGLNNAGQLGRVTSYIDPTPGPVSGGRYAQITSGQDHTCAVGATDHLAYCWGANGSGQLGQPARSPVTSVTPMAIPNLQFAWLAAGTRYTCGVLTNGTGECWGFNNAGQLGNGTNSLNSGLGAITGGLTFMTP